MTRDDRPFSLFTNISPLSKVAMTRINPRQSDARNKAKPAFEPKRMLF
jgi:serine/threonine protein kinase HipA of HipAB toxin-antitoxin module